MLGIIIVDYKSSDLTIKYILNQLVKIKIDWKLVIVNNCATSESNIKFNRVLNSEIVSDDLKAKDISNRIFVVASTENLGFARGNNLGAKFLVENFGCDFLLFSNNDIVLKDNDVIEKLIEKIHSDTDIGMIGPEVIGLDGKRQSPEPYISIESRFFWPYILTPFLSTKYKIKKFGYDYAEKASQGVHFRIMGSFFIMPTSAYISINGFDPYTFLYAEEMILAKRLESINKKVFFLPSVTVIHAHGITTSKVFSNYKSRILQAESERYFYTHYCGVSEIKASILFYFYKTYLWISLWIKKLL